jgi:cobalamin synthase
MTGIDLFTWWAVCISGGSVFLTLVSIYLYASSRARRREDKQTSKKATSLVKNFIFVWILLSLLVFYIISINIGSLVIFAAGNIIVEALLILYLIKNRTEKSERD